MKYYIILVLCVITFLTIACTRHSETGKSLSADIKNAQSKSNPISAETTKITYYHHTNSGIAISTKVEICEDHLIWDYHEMRNGCHLKDTCKYDKNDYIRLTNDLSMIRFSAKDAHDTSSGGEGYAFAFEKDSKQYFYYNDTFKLSGDYEQVRTLVLQFIDAHKTECELLFERLSKAPHEKGEMGEFDTLPEELKPYEVKER